MSNSFRLRPPGVQDAVDWVRVKDAAWRAAYGTMFGTSFLSERESKWVKNAERWAEAFAALDADGYIWRDGEKYRFMIAETDEEMIGLCAVRYSDRDMNIPWDRREEGSDRIPPLDLSLLYVAPEHWRHGVGTALFREMVGDEPAYLWTLKANFVAEAFYRRLGFYCEGTEQILVENLAMRMVRDPARVWRP